jgi:hypothetical protein
MRVLHWRRGRRQPGDHLPRLHPVRLRYWQHPTRGRQYSRSGRPGGAGTCAAPSHGCHCRLRSSSTRAFRHALRFPGGNGLRSCGGGRGGPGGTCCTSSSALSISMSAGRYRRHCPRRLCPQRPLHPLQLVHLLLLLFLHPLQPIYLHLDALRHVPQPQLLPLPPFPRLRPVSLRRQLQQHPRLVLQLHLQVLQLLQLQPQLLLLLPHHLLLLQHGRHVPLQLLVSLLPLPRPPLLRTPPLRLLRLLRLLRRRRIRLGLKLERMVLL